MKTRPKVAALMLLILGVGQAQARDFIEIATPYFTVDSVLSEKETRALTEEMRIFQAVVTSFTSVKDLRPQVPLRIHLVSSDDWKTYLRPTKNVAGFMSPRPLGFDAVMDAYSWSNASRILFHEYVHFVLRNARTGAYPIWFDEGLAEFLSTVKIVKGKVRVGEPSAAMLLSLRGVGRAQWVPIDQLLQSEANPANDHEQEQRQVSGFYAQCWAMIHYMVFEHSGGAKALQQYLLLRRQGAEFGVAFNSAFGLSAAELNDKLARYVQRSTYKIVTIDLENLTLPTFDPYEVRQLSAAESELDLGQLLIRLGARRDSSITYFDRVLKSRPHNAEALAGKANVLEQNQQHEAADAAINKALELAPDEQSVLIAAGNIHFLRYSRLPQSGEGANRGARMEQGRKMVDYYDRAMALPDAFIDKPEIVERYASLALYVRAELNRPLDRITKTRVRYPTSPELAATHARLLTAMNRPTDAREPWQVVAQYGRGAMRDAALKALAARPRDMH